MGEEILGTSSGYEHFSSDSVREDSKLPEEDERGKVEVSSATFFASEGAHSGWETKEEGTRSDGGDQSTRGASRDEADGIPQKQGTQPQAPARPSPTSATQPAAPLSTLNRKIVPTIVHTELRPADERGHDLRTIRLVPIQFQYCEMHDILVLVSSMLDRLLAYNDTLPPPSSAHLTRFHSKAAPAISAFSYLLRITTFVSVDPCILLIMLHCIQLLSQSDYLTINSLTVHRFIISAVCCGSKALSDSFATNSRYAKVGGVELVEMNALEREFLKAIDWRLATSGALLDMFWRNLVESHPGYQLANLDGIGRNTASQGHIPGPLPESVGEADVTAATSTGKIDETGRPNKRHKEKE